MHALCKHGAKCFRCLCGVCNTTPGDVMRPCKVCKHRVHASCAIAVPHRIEVVCKVCSPKPQVKGPPAKKKVVRKFNPKWQVCRLWLKYANGVMWCTTCREYPQPGMHKTWCEGNIHLRHHTVKERSKSGLHAQALALWESGGASCTVMGGLPLEVRRAILGLFLLVYCILKRSGAFTDLSGDAQAAAISGGAVAPAYRSARSAREITHSIAGPIRAFEAQVLKEATFYALASDSSTNCAVHKQELVYTNVATRVCSRHDCAVQHRC